MVIGTAPVSESDTDARSGTPLVADEPMVGAPAGTPPEQAQHLPYNMPQAIYEEVMMGNLHVVEEQHLLDRDYFQFMRGLVEAYGVGQAASSKMRRRDAPAAATSAGSAGGDAGDASAQPGSNGAIGVRGEDRERLAARVMELAMHFMFKVYLRAAVSLRNDAAQWAAALESLLEASPAACAVFLQLLLPRAPGPGPSDPEDRRNEWLEEGLLLAPCDQVRGFVGRLILHALKTCTVGLGGQPLPEEEWQHRGAVLGVVEQLVDSVWVDVAPVAQFSELCELVAKFVQLGAPQLRCVVRSPSTGLAAVVEGAIKMGNRFHVGECSFLELLSALRLVTAVARGLDLQEHISNAPATAGRVSPHTLQGGWQLVRVSAQDYKTINSSRLVALCFIDHLLGDNEVVCLLQLLSWNNRAVSLEVLKHVQVNLQRLANRDLNEISPPMAALVTGVSDDLTQPRLKWLLCGEPPNGDALLPTMCHKHMSQHRRLLLMRFITQLAGYTSHMQANPSQALLGHVRALIADSVGAHTWRLQVQALESQYPEFAAGGLQAGSEFATVLQVCDHLLPSDTDD